MKCNSYFAIAGIVGVTVVVGTILLLSNQLKMTGDNVPFALPQANLMSTLTAGIMSGQLPWVMIIAGAVMGVVLYLLNLPIMTVAIGFYLPIATTSIILVGALVRVFVEKTSKSENEKEAKVANGISLSSGLVAGGSIIGLVGIILQVSGVVKGADTKWICCFKWNGNNIINSFSNSLLVLPYVTCKVKNNEQ